MFKFAFSWHTEKFILGSLVLLIFLLFLCSLAGSLILGSVLYAIMIGILGFADYQKMFYRTEPIYPDDLKMITEFGLLREMIGTIPFVIILLIAGIGLFFFGRAIYKSRLLSKKMQIIRISGLMITMALLMYISNFNNPNNLLRKAYNETALWIPYSQKMNYYNTGFMGGFLYNLKVDAMDKPENYSKKTIEDITTKYTKTAQKTKDSLEEQPNIIFVMSESFSNPQHLNGVTVNKDPLKAYYDIAKTTYSGRMLSQNYGGGTANIEFEALTSFSMELFNPQLTTPYTMLIPKMKEIPSIVSLLNQQDYRTTAIHPYNTSMYKRKDVYQTMGFNQFISEETMKYTQTLENNPYISDESAYKEVLDLLKEEQHPQFVHLVTMQTHMPYSDKYKTSDYSSRSLGNKKAIDSYMQDVAYSSEALKQFTNALKELKRRTLVVFWGDHLPSIYSDEIKADNDEVNLHQTEFLLYDNQGKLSEKSTHDAITSPFYFAPSLFEQSGMEMPGFYQLLSELEKQVPAFEKSFYYKDKKWNKSLALNKAQEALYEDYRLIQYDIVSGERYSLKNDFFK
ncbi:membrane-oligosaccharide glycerophosphotransferase [Enterococcus caccae]|nr:membrane-oligosaccharide glycerophosphotransferase [Enterococcus caccae]